jgi:hypothetical protein
MKTGTELITHERDRHAVKYDADHDDEHCDGELVDAAECLLMIKSNYGPRDDWGLVEKHPDRVEQLTIAGALLAAEIDRLQRIPKTPDDRLAKITELIEYQEDITDNELLKTVLNIARGVTP